MPRAGPHRLRRAHARRLPESAHPFTSFASLPDGDAYYYAYRSEGELPVYRAILEDPQQSRLYISPAHRRRARGRP